MGHVLSDDMGLGTFLGTIGLFLALMFLFVRVLPAISIFEMREVVHHGKQPTHADGDNESRSGSNPPAIHGVMAEFETRRT